jgi:hypothetical protein
VVDISPPMGIELAGFHFHPDKPRLVERIRQPTAARAIVLQRGETLAAIVVMDLLYIHRDVTDRLRQRIERQCGIPASHVRVCITHTHSMPSLRHMIHWGGVCPEYRAATEDKAVEAVQRAKDDLAPAELRVGSSPVVGGSFNRTTSDYKTDAQFTADSTDAERWLDTRLHAMHFERTGTHRDLLWYHYSAHPVCYADNAAGPDWPGAVAEKLQNEQGLRPAYLQGHIGDVNPGDGRPWRGDVDEVVAGVYPALRKAIASARPVDVDCLQAVSEDVALPLDLPLLRQWLSEYQSDPKQCTDRLWVDEWFAREWFKRAKGWDFDRATLPAIVSAMRLGEVGLVFHPSELYSFYGLAMRRGSPLPITIPVGFADDSIGYLTDPTAYEKAEYAALVVPKILALPPFEPTAARRATAAAVAMLEKLNRGTPPA